MTADPLAFLRATLDAVQAEAEAAKGDTDGNWRPDDFPYPGSGRIVDSNGGTVVYDEGSPNEDQAAHIVANDPAAVLCRVAADRKLIELHAPTRGDAGDGSATVCAECANHSREEIEGEPYPCGTIRLIAEGWGWTGVVVGADASK